MKDTVLIIPTYNESRNIERLLNELRFYGLDILIVDDNSPDGTAKYVKENVNYGESIFLLQRKKKLGLGSAYRDGFKWAIQNEYLFMAQMDADFSHRIKDLGKLLNKKNEYGLVLGSRYIAEAKTDGWNIRRVILSKYANKITKYITSSEVSDMTSGFRVYKKNTLENIQFETTKNDGYSFQIEMLLRVLSHEIPVKEVPIIFEGRAGGKSKLNKSIIFEAILLILNLTIRKIMNKEI